MDTVAIAGHGVAMKCLARSNDARAQVLLGGALVANALEFTSGLAVVTGELVAPFRGERRLLCDRADGSWNRWNLPQRTGASE